MGQFASEVGRWEGREIEGARGKGNWYECEFEMKNVKFNFVQYENLKI